ncbi:NUDIX hydrolase [Bacteroidota bacterium]
MERPNGFISQLSQLLKEDLPGQASQYKMAPGVRLENRHGFYQNAAVMILLYRNENAWHTVLMRRPDYKGAHSNQVSLPGGKHEDRDIDLKATALRETHEELGIDDSAIRILGKLSRLHIPVSGIEVSPYVGVFPEKPVFKPNPAEVAYLIEVSLMDLLAPENVREELRTLLNKPVMVPYYQIGEEQIWGATAMVLSEFLDVVSRLEEFDLQ